MVILVSGMENVDAIGLCSKVVYSNVIPQNKISFREVSQIDKTFLPHRENSLETLSQLRTRL
jgi:hypothetical protein